MIVPGGGLAGDGRWISCKPNFLLPVRVLSQLFRRLMLEKLLAAHQAGALKFFGTHTALADPTAFAAFLAPLRTKRWFVYAKRPFAGPQAVLTYLSRYTHRVAISNRRLVALDEQRITFNVKDYRIEGPGRYTRMTLDVPEFIRRFLIHVLPRGFHRIRHYGLFAGSNRAKTIEELRKLLNMAPAAADQASDTDQAKPLASPCPCRGGRMFIIETFEAGCQPRHRPPGLSSQSGSIPREREHDLLHHRARAEPVNDRQRYPAARWIPNTAFEAARSVKMQRQHRPLKARRPILRRRSRHSSVSTARSHAPPSNKIPIARGSAHLNFPRVPSLEAFRRRPMCSRRQPLGPSSETLHNNGLMHCSKTLLFSTSL
jgi:Putative transposase